MKHIEKNPEPQVLADWRNREYDPENEGWRPRWDNFQNPEKHQTHLSLLNEQGNICCYCMCTIDDSTSHIEHIKPRSMSTEVEKLTYTNMLASCQGEGEESGTIQKHCGHFRRNWYEPAQYVSPLDPNCEDRFKFIPDGSIQAVQGDTGAKEMIQHLHLNYSRLNKLRRAYIIAVLGDGTDVPTTAEIQQLINRYSSRNENGSFLPFCKSVVSVLRMYLQAN